jgi:hypothetical protein
VESQNSHSTRKKGKRNHREAEKENNICYREHRRQ